MPDYVYALHDFAPEHEDEISFHAGERIEVIEKDDLYSDGWWQGRNLAGQTGLFPQAYTTSAPPTDVQPPARTPTTSSALQPLAEDPAEAQDSTVMAATMTDIQEAIDQLGIRGDHDNDHDASRSFSFASTKDDTDHEHDSDRETDEGDHIDDDEWRKGARKMLAEKALREMERREKAEAAYSPRTSIPPIEAEISDESDGEDEEHHKISPLTDRPLSVGTPRAAEYPIPRSPSPKSEQRLPVFDAEQPAVVEHASPALPPRRTPSPRPLDSPLRLVSRDSTLSLPSPSSDAHPSPRGSEQVSPPSLSPVALQPSIVTVSPTPPVSDVRAPPTPRLSGTPLVAAATLPLQSQPSSRPPSHPPLSRAQSYSNTPSSALQERSIHEKSSVDIATSLPSPAASSIGVNGFAVSTAASTTLPRSSAGTPSIVTTSVTTPPSHPRPMTTRTHPSEWTIDQVVDWLKQKGFDDGICAKFIEHEITGDVLLELDANLLKELDIVAFGKRMRIANAINELHRPPSVVSSEHSGRNGHNSMNAMSTPGSFTQGHNLRQSVSSAGQHSMPSPSPLASQMMSPESPPHTGDIVETPEQRLRPGSDPGTDLTQKISSIVGLGITSPIEKQPKSKPAALNLSPSDSALKARAQIVDQILENPQEEERVRDERAVMSESETAQGLEQRTNKRRKVFGRMSDSSHVSDPQGTPPPSATSGGATPRSAEAGHKTKRSVDVKPASAEQGSRLSFFGGTLGKTRKPPPRVASGDHTEAVQEKNRTLSRFHIGSSTKRPPSRAGSEFASADAYIKDNKEPATLRKRTISASDVNSGRGGKVALKPGMSIVDQIGEADYSGWMRKRGERYNTWKMRYFILKGPHLYYLRSRNETKLKGYINIVGYKVIADENANPGRYGFRIIHDTDKTHYFSSEEQLVVREWMKAIMKATIDRDYTRPVISSCNIPTIPLTVAQAMNPSPRPPSPTARDATQKALRRENPNQLSSRDARILMGLPSSDGTPPIVDPESRKRMESFYMNDSHSTNPPPSAREALTPPVSPSAPPRPTREQRKPAQRVPETPANDADLIKWINSHLPKHMLVNDVSASLATGLVLFRVAESIKGRSMDVPDTLFPTGPNDDRLDGLFKLFDFLIAEDVRIGSVSINDLRQGKRDKIVQVVRALKAWEDKRIALVKSVGQGAMMAGPWMGTVTAR